MGQKAVEIESVNDAFKMQSGLILLDSLFLSVLIAGVILWDHIRVISVGLGTRGKWRFLFHKREFASMARNRTQSCILKVAHYDSSPSKQEKNSECTWLVASWVIHATAQIMGASNVH